MSTLIERAREAISDKPGSTVVDVEALCRLAVAVAEALPGLKQECRCSFEPCLCGADEHNATLDRLRGLLESE